MVQVLDILLACSGVLLCGLTMVLSCEIGASFLGFREKPIKNSKRPVVGVLVPAHNEAAIIKDTVEAIQTGLEPEDRLLVVADNCNDNTAKIALECGAEVVVRDDRSKHGKGFALEFGRQHFALNPPDVLIIIDADCKPVDSALRTLAERAMATGRPTQALYLMERPAKLKATSRLSIPHLAWRIKNCARPLGLRNLGLPCQLMGTGMAFPWRIMARRNMATEEIVEDLALGIELASEGCPPNFVPGAIVVSFFPSSSEGQSTQRSRWELGHLNLIRRALAEHLFDSVKKRDWSTLCLLLDLAVPPLSLLVMLVAAHAALTGLSVMFGGAVLPLALSIAATVLLIFGVLLGWSRAARDVVSFSEVLMAPRTLASKLGMYLAFFIRNKRTGWIKTKRDVP